MGMAEHTADGFMVVLDALLYGLQWKKDLVSLVDIPKYLRVSSFSSSSFHLCNRNRILSIFYGVNFFSLSVVLLS